MYHLLMDDFPLMNNDMMTMTRESVLGDIRFLLEMVANQTIDARDAIRRLRAKRREFECIYANPRHLTHDDEATLYAIRQWFMSKPFHQQTSELRRFCEESANEFLHKRIAENMVIVVHYDELQLAVKQTIAELQYVLQIGAKYRAKLYARSIRKARNKWALQRVKCECGKEYMQSNKTKHERTAFHKNACKKEENMELIVEEKRL